MTSKWASLYTIKPLRNVIRDASHVLEMFPGQLRWKVSESTMKTVEVDWSHLCELKSVYGQSEVSIPISHSIISHRRWQKWRDIIAFRNFDLASRTPNNSSLNATRDVQLSTRIKRVSRSAQREVRSFDATPRRLLKRKLHFVLDIVGRRSLISRTRESQGWSLKTLHAATISLLFSLLLVLSLRLLLSSLLLSFYNDNRSDNNSTAFVINSATYQITL